MIDLKKLDEKDVVFLNKKTSKEDDLKFSDFLKNRKKVKLKVINSKKKIKKEKASM